MMPAQSQKSQKSGTYRSVSPFPIIFGALFFLGSLLFFVLSPRQLSTQWINKEEYLQSVRSATAKAPASLPPPPPPPPSPPAASPTLVLQRPKKSFDCNISNPCSLWNPRRKSLAELQPNPNKCPDYFMFIHEDLKPWKESGITLEMVESARRTANFRLIIVDGRMYLQNLNQAFQTRDVFSIWGFVQLLEHYPGILPDVDLMFDCVDWPVVEKNESVTDPPPLFRYCSDEQHLDIPFPDWSFWGWAEVHSRPWEGLLNDIANGNNKIKWEDRDPTAYWKGNPWVAEVRKDLLKCNASEGKDWNARLYIQDWIKESQEGYKQSNLADQCDHRYKIYIEGSAWSVSLKNIMSCNSPTLMVEPKYHDFFSRGLIPGQHFWPIRLDKKCEAVKFAVDWGNNHTKQATSMGQAGSSFMKQDLKMSFVYDYMFHLLNEYSKLLKYKPTVPSSAREICSHSEICRRKFRVERRFMQESLVQEPSPVAPCQLEPFSQKKLDDFRMQKSKGLYQIMKKEAKAWYRF